MVTLQATITRYDGFMVSRIIACVALLFCAGCGNSTAPSSNVSFTQTDLVVGTGATANTGNTVTVAYTGWLFDSSQPNSKGRQFDSLPSYTFTIGAGRVIKGWEQGVPGMRVGGQRRLIIPPELGYGPAGAGGGVIPPNATLVFDITLISIG
jgi:FKBP-type peptidyl-prolyl cis-trans isomerase FkpA